MKTNPSFVVRPLVLSLLAILRCGLVVLATCSLAGAAEPSPAPLMGLVGIQLGPAVENPAGVQIIGVAPGLSAESVGILGDQQERIVAIDGIPLTAPADLTFVSSRLRGPIGTSVIVRIWRADDGTERDLKLRRQVLPGWVATPGELLAPAVFDAIAQLENDLAPLLSAVSTARSALLAASLEAGVTAAALSAKVDALANAELKLSLAKAHGWPPIRKLDLSASQRAALIRGLASYGSNEPRPMGVLSTFTTPSLQSREPIRMPAPTPQPVPAAPTLGLPSPALPLQALPPPGKN